MRVLYIIRGLPGSGKTTLAKQLAPVANHAADDYFTDKDGVYNFDPAKIGEAHQDCQRKVAYDMGSGFERIAVHNTFSESWEARPYFGIALEHGYDVFVIECQNDFGSDHGVPAEAINRMTDRWEPISS